MEETPFPSIIHSFWYVIVTITTVGYGDAYPTTTSGKTIGCITILSGVIVMAMPIGVIGSNFSVEYNNVQNDKKRRVKLQRQQEQLAELEAAEEAAAARKAEEGGDPHEEEAQNPLVVQQVKIVETAQSLEDAWNVCLGGQDVAQPLVFRLRHFVESVCVASAGGGPCPGGGLDLPMQLDILGVHVRSALSGVTSCYDPLAEFGLKEAGAQRELWAGLYT